MNTEGVLAQYAVRFHYFWPSIGIGTTAMATKLLGRRYIGIEILDEYVKQAREKIRKLKS